ncbi:MAG: alpha-L-fucosidase [Phycisphaerae bacterium]|nr:alpha-L-fucosidase [Phycisphaerae bacterium]
MKFNFIFLSVIMLIVSSQAFSEQNVEDYVPVKDPEVKEKLDEWQDLKFGLFMHWGTYSQWGIVESWSLCTEEWIDRDKGRYQNYELYKQDYENLIASFNPVDFNPEKWMLAAKDAGMKYVVFTTKHHDGFCMFDTKTTDYKITSKDCPFHVNKKANVTKEIFDTFRKEGFKIGTYFSKPDWHSEYYWWPYYNTGPRHVNYNPAKYPQRWQQFKDYTYDQVEELMTDYGKIDILWLDGAWVRPIENMPEEYKPWALYNDWDQDVDMARIAKMGRKHQPGLIVVDRWVSGEFENYLTPENKIPDKAILVPWESCITMAPGWSYNKNHEYKSVRQLVHMMVDTVAKGGNFLLNIGPSPKGDWAPDAYDRLKGIGAWMKVNSEAIYDSRPIEPYKDGKVCLTQNKKTKAVYAIYLAGEDETRPPAKIWLNTIQPTDDNTQVTMLGVGELKWEKVGQGILVHIPDEVQKNPPCEHAWTIRIEKVLNFCG